MPNFRLVDPVPSFDCALVEYVSQHLFIYICVCMYRKRSGFSEAIFIFS